MDPNKITITVCGDGGCGKSSITLRLVRSQWTSEYDPTIEDSYSVTRTVDGQTYLLMLTDTAGQEEYRGLWAASNLKSDAFLLVYDITNPASLENLEHFHELITMEEDERLDRGEIAPVKICCGNKCDLQSQRMVRSAQGLEWARNHNCGFMETSAREKVNIEETFALIIRRVVEARRLHQTGPTTQNYAGHRSNKPVAASRTPALPPPNGHVAFADEDPTSEKPLTTIDPSMIKGRQKQGGRGGFWSRLKCW